MKIKLEISEVIMLDVNQLRLSKCNLFNVNYLTLKALNLTSWLIYCGKFSEPANYFLKKSNLNSFPSEKKLIKYHNQNYINQISCRVKKIIISYYFNPYVPMKKDDSINKSFIESSFTILLHNKNSIKKPSFAKAMEGKAEREGFEPSVQI